MDVAGQFYGLEALIVPNKWLIVPSNLNKFIEERRGVRRKMGRERGADFEEPTSSTRTTTDCILYTMRLYERANERTREVQMKSRFHHRSPLCLLLSESGNGFQNIYSSFIICKSI